MPRMGTEPQWPLKHWECRNWAEPGSFRLSNHNKVACALANKLARICYAVLKHHEPYGAQTRREENKKTNRTAYAVAA